MILLLNTFFIQETMFFLVILCSAKKLEDFLCKESLTDDLLRRVSMLFLI